MLSPSRRAPSRPELCRQSGIASTNSLALCRRPLRSSRRPHPISAAHRRIVRRRRFGLVGLGWQLHRNDRVAGIKLFTPVPGLHPRRSCQSCMPHERRSLYPCWDRWRRTHGHLCRCRCRAHRKATADTSDRSGMCVRLSSRGPARRETTSATNGRARGTLRFDDEKLTS